MSERKAFKDLTLSDNFMFGAVMQDKNICRLFLSEILKKDIVEIDFSKNEYPLNRIYNSQSVRLDIIATDSSGTVYDIEMQKTNKKDIEKRSRYYFGAIDKEFFSPGHKDYTKLKDCYVIFICTFDYVGRGYALYEKTCCYNNDPDMPFFDGTHFIMLNATYDREKTNIELPIEEFLSIIKGIESNYSSALAQSVSEKIIEVRQDQEMEVSYMTLDELIQDERDEARAEGFSKGIEQGKAEGIEQGLNDALRILGISREKFEKIKNSN